MLFKYHSVGVHARCTSVPVGIITIDAYLGEWCRPALASWVSAPSKHASGIMSALPLLPCNTITVRSIPVLPGREATTQLVLTPPRPVEMNELVSLVGTMLPAVKV